MGNPCPLLHWAIKRDYWFPRQLNVVKDWSSQIRIKGEKFTYIYITAKTIILNSPNNCHSKLYIQIADYHTSTMTSNTERPSLECPCRIFCWKKKRVPWFSERNYRTEMSRGGEQFHHQNYLVSEIPKSAAQNQSQINISRRSSDSLDDIRQTWYH